MSNQIVISSGAKVRNLNGVLTGTSGVVDALGINVPDGIPQLDGSGKILVSQLPNSVMEFKGTWNAATNTPTLADGIGNAGDVYLCNVAGTVNFGSGPIEFFVGDQVLYSGTEWERASGATGTVSSVAVTESGDALTITGSPITTSGTINIGFAGTSGQYVNGAGGLTTFPSLTGFVPYTGATSDVDLGIYGLKGTYLEVNTTPPASVNVGQIAWNPIDGTFDMGLIGGVTLQAGQELHFYGKASGAIGNGKAVMFAGVEGDHLLMSEADAATINANPQYFIGVATQDFANNDFGYVTVLGKVRGLDTTAYTLGQVLYFDSTSATDGLLTATMPSAPNAKIEVCAVVRVHATQGILMVRPHVMPLLSDLQNVNTSGQATNDGLFLDSDSVWKPKTISEVLGYTPANDSLVVHLAGTETITGLKTFSQDITVNSVNVGKGAGSGTNNVAIGDNVLTDNTTGNANIGIGSFPLWNNTTGFGNIAIGREALIGSQVGSLNIAIGDNTMKGVVTGGQNIAIGANVAQSATSGSNNLMIGYNAANGLTTGAGNLFLGYAAGSTVSTGNYNTIIGGFPSFSSAGSLSNNVIIADGQGNIRFQWNGSQTLISGVALGSNAFTSTAYLPLTGGTLTGALSGTSATFSGNVGIGTISPTSPLHILSTTEPQFKVEYDSANWTTLSHNTLNYRNTDFIFKENTTERMRIKNGNVGIGTSSPTSKLHIYNSGVDGFTTLETTGGFSAYNRNKNGNRSWVYGVDGTSSSWIVLDETAGLVRMAVTSSGNVGIGTSPSFGKLWVEQNEAFGVVINTSNTNPAGLYLRNAGGGENGFINSNVALSLRTDNIERMRITSGGDLLVGKSALGWTVNGIQTEGSGTLLGITSSVYGENLFLRKNGTTGNMVAFFYNSGGVGTISISTTTTSYNTSSDYRLKQDLKDFNGLSLISSIKTYDYEWKSDNSRSYGVMAHELQEVLPYAVNGEKDAVNEDGTIKAQGVDYSKIVPVNTKAIQELYQLVLIQDAKIEELKALIAAK